MEQSDRRVTYREALSHGDFHNNGHEALDGFLAPTSGYLVYQEQIIDFLHKFCSHTMGEADIVRRVICKKLVQNNFASD